MNNATTLMMIVFFMVFVGFIAVETGLAEETIEVPEEPPEPVEGGGWLSGFDALINLARWAFNVTGAIFQLMTFQLDVPTEINMLIITPIAFGAFYIGIGLIRGGGG